MQIIHMKQGQVVAVEERDPSRQPQTARDEITRMFDLHSGFAGWQKPVATLEALYLQAAQEVVQQTEQERVVFQNLFFWQRAWRRLRRQVPQWVDRSYTQKEVLQMYVDKLCHFREWMDVKRRTSRFYAGEFGEEIASCNALIARLEERLKTL